MVKQVVALVAIVIVMSAGTASAQQCLHGADETPDQAVRRREALTATRMIGTLQANGAGSRNGQYFRVDELAAAPYAQTMKTSTNETMRRISLDPLGDILPGWKLTLDVSSKGYWFMIKDRTDPCGFAFLSTQDGLIYTAQPLR
jgi:hypothetical protein